MARSRNETVIAGVLIGLLVSLAMLWGTKGGRQTFEALTGYRVVVAEEDFGVRVAGLADIDAQEVSAAAERLRELPYVEWVKVLLEQERFEVRCQGNDFDASEHAAELVAVLPESWSAYVEQYHGRAFDLEKVEER